ncbi:GNAT family N-acetyltransferase [Vibrio neptunius]|uniref:GNAT family N-acetyltransferase n=1 Tax=Vibrio neptunius TaxID=170651 RepID=UPI003314B4FF
MKFAREFECSSFSFTPIDIGDARCLLAAVGSKQFPEALPLARIKTLHQAEAWCSKCALEWRLGKCYVWSCRRLSHSQVIGQVTLLPQGDRLALAYWINPQFWGQGCATQMCKSLFAHLGRSGYRGSIWAGVHGWNIRSASVLKKLGFEQIVSSDANTLEYRMAFLCQETR